ncbi:MAG: hypothetical protein QME76_05015 [Bacillota bacterium]|nr:hypothetical protein [Bacillota bacterium]
MNNLREQLYAQRQQYRKQMLSQFTDEQLAQMVRSGGCGCFGGFGRGGFGGGFAPNVQ